jgi:hypothetical protein
MYSFARCTTSQQAIIVTFLSYMYFSWTELNYMNGGAGRSAGNTDTFRAIGK